MKINRTLFIVAIALVSVLGACKKDYTCKCSITIPDPFGSGSITSDTSYVISKSTKKNAKSDCSTSSTNINSSASFLGGSGSCSLK